VLQHPSVGAIGGRGLSSAGSLITRTIRVVVLAAISVGLFSLVSIYGYALRDPRYLDGWVLAGGMSLQLGFHVAIKTNKLSPKSVARWRKFHIFVGYLLIAAFLSHTNFSLPDAGFEWALWTGFALVMLSGIFGTYLTWSAKAKGIDDRFSSDPIPSRAAELAREVREVVAMPDPASVASALPAPPHDAWIADLYANHLKDYFERRRNFFSCLVGSQNALQRLTAEIDSLSPYVDARRQEKLAAIRNLVIEKDRLDFARVHSALSRGWQFVHVPVTYGLIVLSVLHVLVVYSYSSGGW
jgi:hypothetical protein